jgi:hypothetical protein
MEEVMWCKGSGELRRLAGFFAEKGGRKLIQGGGRGIKLFRMCCHRPHVRQNDESYISRELR